LIFSSCYCCASVLRLTSSENWVCGMSRVALTLLYVRSMRAITVVVVFMIQNLIYIYMVTETIERLPSWKLLQLFMNISKRMHRQPQRKCLPLSFFRWPSRRIARANRLEIIRGRLCRSSKVSSTMDRNERLLTTTPHSLLLPLLLCFCFLSPFRRPYDTDIERETHKL
jgi:hypothetical protein